MTSCTRPAQAQIESQHAGGGGGHDMLALTKELLAPNYCWMRKKKSVSLMADNWYIDYIPEKSQGPGVVGLGETDCVLFCFSP